MFNAGVEPAQNRDLADAAVRASEAAVKSFEDQVRASEAQVDVARANRKQVDVQQSDLAATRAQLVQARADKATAEVHLSYMKIYSPLDGVVSVRAARQGEVLQAGEPIVTILDVDHLWVQADVEESYIDSVQLNQTSENPASFRKHHRGSGHFQRRGKRFRDAAGRQPDQARYQNFFHQSVRAKSRTQAHFGHDRNGVCCRLCPRPKAGGTDFGGIRPSCTIMTHNKQ